MKLASPWKITWDPDGSPLVLVAFGQEIAEEPRFPARQRIDTREPIEADESDFLARKLWATTLRLTVFKEHASDTAARLYVPVHTADCQAVGRKDLYLEYDDGAGGTDTVTVPRASLADIEGGRVARAGTPQTEFRYTFRGGRILAGTPGGQEA